MNLRLSQKIPAIITLATLITGGALTYFATHELRVSAEHTAQKSMQNQLMVREKALTAYLQTIIADMHTQGNSPLIIQATNDFTRAWAALGNNQTKYLQDLYITNNPNKTGEKHLLDAAPDGTEYSRLHAFYHPYLRDFLVRQDYYDIFIFDTKGNLLYTVFKELDYATNLNTGEWKDSGLGEIYRMALAQESAQEVSYIDFAPYAPSHGAPASFMGRPIEDAKGNRIGVLVYQMPIANLNAIFNDERGLGETGKIVLVGNDGLARNDIRFAKESTILKHKVESDEAKAALGNESGVNLYAKDINGEHVITAYMPFDFKGAHFALMYEMAYEEVMRGMVAARNELFMISAVIIALITIAGIFFARTISNPLNRITGAMEEISQNKLETEVPARDRKDEIGEMAAALQVFKENGIRMNDMKEEQARQAKKAEEEKRKAMQQLADDFESKVQSIIDTVATAASQMCDTAEGMKGSVTNASTQAGEAASSSGQTSHNVENVAAAIEEMSASVREIAGQVSKSSEIVTDAVDKAQNADEIVRSLSEAVTQIGDISILIQGIADQINLLALNATIESARAGEAGKGFAVVASEVKNLATQTANATDQIIQNIENVKVVSEKVSEALVQIQGSIKDVNQYSSGIAAAVEEQSAATDEITANMQQASQGVQNINNNISNVSKDVEIADAGAIEVLDSAKLLSQQSTALSEQVKQFLASIRSDKAA